MGSCFVNSARSSGIGRGVKETVSSRNSTDSLLCEYGQILSGLTTGWCAGKHKAGLVQICRYGGRYSISAAVHPDRNIRKHV